MRPNDKSMKANRNMKIRDRMFDLGYRFIFGIHQGLSSS